MTAVALPDLPAELIHEISNYMSYGSRLALQLSCRELFAKTNRPNRPTKGYNMADLLEIEQWREYNGARFMPPERKQSVGQRDFFACYLCLKICSADRFANAMMKGKRGKLGQGTVRERSKRFCIQCGIKHGRYQAGTYLQFGGWSAWYEFVCRGCGKLEVTRYCSEAQVAERRCTVCWDRTHKKSGTV
ncbi:hypothetical protein F5884DRAFT_687977 [Xylogone sp. PMI_703]|nr:hypothetical protein F5884DRAFT_687977 [Xylogone sp. PMI_703]